MSKSTLPDNLAVVKAAVTNLLREHSEFDYYPALRDPAGGIAPAFMLSYAISRRGGEGGWWPMTVAEWAKATGLTPKQQKLANRKLLERGFFEIVKIGVPARNHYRVNWDKVAEVVF